MNLTDTDSEYLVNIVHNGGGQENPFPENFLNRWLARDAAVELLCDDPAVKETVIVRMDTMSDDARYTTLETISRSDRQVVNRQLERIEEETKLCLHASLASAGEEVIRHFVGDRMLGALYSFVFSDTVRDATAERTIVAYENEAFRTGCRGPNAREHFQSFVRQSVRTELLKSYLEHGVRLPATFAPPNASD